MIPLVESTILLPQVQGVGVRNRDFSLTLLHSARRQLSAVCVSSSSPAHTTTTSLRKTQSSERRRSSLSSISRESKIYKEQDFWQQQSRIKRNSAVLSLATQGLHQKLLIKMSPEKGTNSSLETKTEQVLEVSSTHSNHVDEQASKNLPKAKNKIISLSRTSKSTNKNRKLSKSRKSCNRRKSTKLSRKVPSVFERLTNSTFKDDNQLDREKSKYPTSARNEITMLHNSGTCGTLLQIKQLQATYSSPRRSTKPKTFLWLPEVPRLTKLETYSTKTVQKGPEVIKTDGTNCQVTSPGKQKSVNMNSRGDENFVSCKKIYLSEMQSTAIDGVPSAPPGTPSLDQLKKIEYVPSLTDIKSQRAIKSKLEKIVHKLRREEQHRKENSIKQDQKKLKESLMQLKQRQRLEIYALNRVMTELENENFKKFMEKKEAVSLGV